MNHMLHPIASNIHNGYLTLVELGMQNQLPLLAGCGVSISQAGYNTMVEALAAGARVVVLDILLDRPADGDAALAAASAAHGAGIAEHTFRVDGEVVVASGVADGIEEDLDGVVQPGRRRCGDGFRECPRDGSGTRGRLLYHPNP